MASCDDQPARKAYRHERNDIGEIEQATYQARHHATTSGLQLHDQPHAREALAFPRRGDIDVGILMRQPLRCLFNVCCMRA